MSELGGKLLSWWARCGTASRDERAAALV